MDTDIFSVLISLLCVFVLLFFNGVFVCAEFAFVKARKTRMEELKDKGEKRAAKVLFGIDHLDAYLSVCQLGITLTSLGLGWLGEPALSALLRPLFSLLGMSDTAIKSVSVIAGFIIITFLHVVFGELAPKNIAIIKSENMVLSLASMMKFFYYLFYPFVIALNGTANSITKIFRIKPPSKKETTLSSEELKLIIEDSQEGGHIEEREEEIIQNVLDFDEKTVKDIMTPRPDVAFLESEMKISEILPVVKEKLFTRYPVTDSEDRIVGVLHLKDAFCTEKDVPVKKISAEPLFVPELMSVESLLDKFKASHKQIAIVIDEYGIYSGIVTMEDVLEEIVGEIQDEFSNEADPVTEKDGVFYISGKTDIEEMCEKLDMEYDSDRQDISTAAGFVIDIMGVIPKTGDTFEYGNYKWTVLNMDSQRIVRIKAQKQGE